MEDRTQQMGGPNGGAVPPTVLGVPRTQMGVMPTQMGANPMQTVMQPPMSTLEVECIPGNRYAMAPEVSREHALVVLKASGQQLGRRAPINICLCIDRSGSMEGEPLEYVKRACDYVVDMLEPNDILSIVTFEEQVDVLMPARRIVNKALVKEHIHRLEVGNTTNLYDGLMAACMQIASVMPQTPGYVHRVLLLTDGEPTAGLKDYNSIVQQVAEQKTKGISVTALGFGSEYNEELMAGIARRSGGNYYYIQRPDLLPEVYRRELETLMTIVAKNVRVRFLLSRWAQVRQVYGQQPAFGPRTVEVTVPDIERGTVRTVLAEFELDRHPPGTFRVARVEVTYDDVVNNRTERAGADCVLEFTNDRSLLAANVNQIVRNELEIAQASQNLQRTMMGMRTQQMTAMGALQELQRTRTVLIQAGQADRAREVEAAMQTIQSGGDVEKTIVGTIYNLDQGKHK
ncbi:MAG TPA: VWA domain-containing protein [Chthonomonadaceae bacterium]|nr:VWA domain-containing protein [Chthonomonadaceae bacterium]